MNVMRTSGLGLILLLTACATTVRHVPVLVDPPTQARPAAQAACRDCGRVHRIELIDADIPSIRRGAVLGGVVGSVVSKPAPATGAAPASRAKIYRIALQMDDGRKLVVKQNSISPRLRAGSVIRFTNGRVVLLR